MLCIETTKENVQPAPPGGGPTGTPAGTFACYKVKCPKGLLPPVGITDQFGTLTVSPRGAKLLCAPVSTTVTTTSSTTPTTCGGLIPCCTGNQCTLYCAFGCIHPGCTLGQPCGTTSSSTTVTTVSSTTVTTCGQLLPCCMGGQCVTFCSALCGGGSNCVVGQPCGGTTTTP